MADLLRRAKPSLYQQPYPASESSSVLIQVSAPSATSAERKAGVIPFPKRDADPLLSFRPMPVELPHELLLPTATAD
ncbi:MAG TPA: hypothetical protein VG714_05835 [Acidobacteriaceae bacterium]|nr:hypothetical protein [Acidobacteriaceae bacterium]